MVRHIITGETTLRRSLVNRVVQVAGASTTCVGLRPSILKGMSGACEKYRTAVTTGVFSVLAECAKLVGKPGVSFGVLSGLL